MKTKVSFAKPDERIEGAKTIIDLPYWINLESIFGVNSSLILHNEAVIDFLDDYEFDSRKNIVYFSVTAQAVCHKDDKFDSTTGYRIAVTKAQKLAHLQAGRFLMDLWQVLYYNLGLHDLDIYVWHNLETHKKCIEHIEKLSEN